MFVVPVNPNEISIQYFENGCCKSEFDSTYPIQLNGIISQHEFEQSINKINEAFYSKISLIIWSLLFILCVGSGIILFIAGGITAANSHPTGIPVLVAIGLGLVGFGIVFLCIGCCIMQSQRTTRLRQVVAEESRKYSMRSPTPCSWRIHIYTYGTGSGRNRGTKTGYRLFIDIGNRAGYNAPYQYNQVPPQPTSFYTQQNNTTPSAPPYYSQSAAAFCSRCGMSRQNLVEKFCPSCGQLFNI